VKRWQYFALAVGVVAGSAYVYLHRGSLGLSNLLRASGEATDVADGIGRLAKLNWKTVDRPNDGFKLELPADVNDLEVPAYNEAGATEPIKMLFANPDADTTFAITWQDNPPVVRVNRAAEKTLNMARDGMLGRTQTTLVNESHGLHQGYPSLDVSARNAGGGILNARLISCGNRLYVLMALFPSASARRDVTRFFNSFVPSRPSIAETTPSPSPQR
jgi:hypothetical protein